MKLADVKELFRQGKITTTPAKSHHKNSPSGFYHLVDVETGETVSPNPFTFKPDYPTLDAVLFMEDQNNPIPVKDAARFGIMFTAWLRGRRGKRIALELKEYLQKLSLDEYGNVEIYPHRDYTEYVIRLVISDTQQ